MRSRDAHNLCEAIKANTESIDHLRELSLVLMGRITVLEGRILYLENLEQNSQKAKAEIDAIVRRLDGERN